MKIVIVHLSDIHLKFEKENIISKRVHEISDALRPLCAEASACFIVATGDIAYSGQVSEYNMALEFFQELLGNIERDHDHLTAEIVLIPGNHDCDFSKDDEARKYLLGEKVIKAHLTAEDDSVVRKVLGVQDAFFDFLDVMEAHNESVYESLEGHKRLYFERFFEIEDKIIRFNCYNSAWMSSKKEQQACLSFPTQIVNRSNKYCDIAIAAFHHPTLWLESNNGRGFRDQVEQTANLVLTGHEHVASQYSKTTPSGQVNEYIEGAQLQGDGPEHSAFNVIEIDLAEEQKIITEYNWKEDLYEPKTAQEWSSLKQWEDRVLESRVSSG